MPEASQRARITIFDTTLRDGELALKRKLTLQQKMRLAKILEQMGVDVIEVGYPGVFDKDAEEMLLVSEQLKNSIVCGLASSKAQEITAVAAALKRTQKGRINIYTPVRIRANTSASELIQTIKESVALARNYCPDVEWSAFDATRSHPDVICKAVETAIKGGARTITICDSLGVAKPEEFAHLIEMVQQRVTNVEQAIIGVHCHDDLGLAEENSLVGLDVGVRQIECSISGLGVRAGNADLAKVVEGIANHSTCYTDIEQSWLKQALEMVNEFIEEDITVDSPGYGNRKERIKGMVSAKTT